MRRCAMIEEDWDWRKMNEEAGLLADDDCRNCSGFGRVPTEMTYPGGIPSAKFGDCPVCSGTGKKPQEKSE